MALPAIDAKVKAEKKGARKPPAAAQSKPVKKAAAFLQDGFGAQRGTTMDTGRAVPSDPRRRAPFAEMFTLSEFIMLSSLPWHIFVLSTIHQEENEPC